MQGQKQHNNAKNSRNNKKKHHATHEPRNRQNNNQQQQSTPANSIIACKICHQELQDLEKEFFPCNCKYKICQKCFKHHVEHENGKCPNCGLLYEVNRVKEYYASKQSQQQVAKQQSSSQLQGASSAKKTRYESPQPYMTPAASLTQPNSSLIQQNNQNSKSGAIMGGKPQNQTRNNKQAAARTQKQTQARQNNQRSGQANNCAASSSKATVAGGVQETNSTSNKIAQTAPENPKSGPKATLVSSNSLKQVQPQSTSKTTIDTRPAKKQRNSSEQQRLQQKLSSVRILQRNTLYVIGLSPNVAKEETLRRYEYFSQYGRILTVTINKEKAFQSENQGLCFSAYINYAGEREASLAILAVDQFVFDGRLLHASYGRTKYCRFFLKGTNCLNHECPYLHKEAHPENILTQEDMNKKILFQQCQQLALKLSKLTEQTEDQFKANLRAHKEGIMSVMNLKQVNRIIMPQLETIFEKKALFKHCLGNSTAAATATQTTPATFELATGTPAAPAQPPAPVSQQAPQMLANATVIPPQVVQQQPHYGQDFQQSLCAVGHQQQQQTAPPQPDISQQTGRAPTFKQHRGSHGCNSELQPSNTAMGMMFSGRNRLQSSGTLGELEFQNKHGGLNALANRQNQLLPQGYMNQSRRFAQDDHYLTRVPPADFRLSTTANGGGPLFKTGGGGVTGVANKESIAPINMTFTNTNQQTSSSSMAAFSLRPRFGSPHPPQNRLYFQQQFVPQNQNSLHATRDSDKMTQQSSQQYKTKNFHHVSQMHYHQPQRHTLQQQSYFLASQDCGVNNSNSLCHNPENRARSGSQAAMALENQFEEAKMPERRRKSSHGKFRIFQEPRKESPSPTNKSEQRRFASKLRQALQQFIKGGDPATDRDSTEQFSSIFAGGEDGRRPMAMKNKITLNYNNCSEGVAGGQACSPIRDSILQSRRNSEDYGTLTRPRSQHSLIVESVARILDDTVLEQRYGDREKQRLQMTNEPNFKTGPPSEVHQLMYDVDQQAEGAFNAHFYHDFESKWNNQFNDMASSNSMTTNPATAAHLQQQTNATQQIQQQQQQQQQTAQKSLEFAQPAQRRMAHTSFQQMHHQTPIQQQQPQQCQNTTFTSPHQNNNLISGHQPGNNVWHKSSSLYNSPFFLIPTHTQNAQHRSAAYHDHTLRHLHSQSNPFSLSGTTGQNFSARGANDNIGMVNDTWRLTYNPHPLLPPTTGGAGHSSNLSSQNTGGLFRNNTTQSDPDHSFPLLSRTTSQPFMMRSEQKVIQRGTNQGQQQNSMGGVNHMALHAVQQRKLNNSQLEFSRSHQIQQQQLQQQNNVAVHQHQQQRKKHDQHQHQAMQLTQRNLELLNKKYCPSKDMLYAKIFTDFVPSASPRSNSKRLNTTTNQVSSFGGLHAPQHPTSVQHYTITPQSLFCFALDGDDSNIDLRQSSTAKLRNKGPPRLHKQVSRDDAALGILSTPTRRKEPSLFFNSSSNNLDNVKETSMTPTNKHSRAIVTNWNDYVGAAHNVNEDTRSLKQLNKNRSSGLMHNETYQDPISADELEMANQLANEASLGFNDLISTMMHHSKSKKSQYDAYAGTRMSAVDGECQPQRSRSQSYRDRCPPAEGQAIMSSSFCQPQQLDETERKQRRDIGGGGSQKRRGDDNYDNSSDSYSSSLAAQKRNIGIQNLQASQGPSVATATTTGGQKNFYQEFVKVREGFRKSSGLISSSGFGATKVETRRSSYSQGRNCSNKTAIQLMDVTRRGSFKQGQLRRSQIISPLGLLKFKNHQIDEVNEDGATERDSKREFKQDPTSVRMNSVDSQSYNLKTLKSVSRSRKESHSQNGTNFD